MYPNLATATNKLSTRHTKYSLYRAPCAVCRLTYDRVFLWWLQCMYILANGFAIMSREKLTSADKWSKPETTNGIEIQIKNEEKKKHVLTEILWWLWLENPLKNSWKCKKNTDHTINFQLFFSNDEKWKKKFSSNWFFFLLLKLQFFPFLLYH